MTITPEALERLKEVINLRSRGIETVIDQGMGDHSEFATVTVKFTDLRAALAALEATQAERDEAQSACTAWRQVYESLEAHLQDRIAMKDAASPETYLRILQGQVEGVARGTAQICAARWADAARARSALEAVEAENVRLREALEPFAKFDLHGFDGIVLEVVPSSPDNPSRRIEPILKSYFERARQAFSTSGEGS